MDYQCSEAKLEAINLNEASKFMEIPFILAVIGDSHVEGRKANAIISYHEGRLNFHPTE